ncbi:MAG TPA: DNA gyrase subunit A, partial [Pyrinomonadaceae bacterium]|nr:DNA gyrase subunit A [Pyrinomonadaceae bacterium]
METITERNYVNIEDEMRRSYLDYAMSVIIGRALPDVRDGFKPGHRRVLWSMHELGNQYNKAYKKSARVCGDTIGKYHPHGESAVYDTVVRMAQDFSMRYPLIDGQGNFGCFTGETKIKLLDGTEKTFAELAELPAAEKFYVYSVDKNGRVVVGEGRHSRVTRQNAELIELTLDNGAKIRCTPDHRFMLRDGTYCEAQHLTPDDSLMPGYFDAAPIKEGLNDYLRVQQPATGKYEFVHHLADDFNFKIGQAPKFNGPFVRHHKNFDRFDNRPSMKYFDGFDDFVRAAQHYNHRVVAKKFLDERAAVYDITVDEHHNFLLADGVFVHNSVDGDSPAAMRYTEVRLARVSSEVLADIEKETVDFRPNYDESLSEPTVLPTRIPNLLINGSDGIAVGMATKIAPHNLSEVIDATIALIRKPEIKIEELIKHVPGPDFPTAGFIYGKEGMRQASLTGRGIIQMRARAGVDRVGRGATERDAIVITEIPYQVNKARLIERIAELVNEKKIEGI